MLYIVSRKMINKKLINRKIELIQTDLNYLSEFKQSSFDEISRDYKKQALVERFLERIINRAIDINQHLITELFEKGQVSPKSYKETFLKLADLEIYPVEFANEISKSVGTRNVLNHEYDNVDYSKIYFSISHCLKDYHSYCDYILKFLK